MIFMCLVCDSQVVVVYCNKMLHISWSCQLCFPHIAVRLQQQSCSVKCNTHSLFSADTGELWFENALDYEEWCDTNFTATVRACDMGPLGENRLVCLNESWFQERCSDTVTIQACLQGVDDNPPVCPNILKQCIPEQDYSSPNRLQIIQINCTDADSSCPNSPPTPFTYTIDSVVVYELSSGQQLNAADVSGLFEVDSNGFLWVIGDIDREGREDVHNDEYLVHMTVTDDAPAPHSTTVGVSLWCSIQGSTSVG